MPFRPQVLLVLSIAFVVAAFAAPAERSRELHAVGVYEACSRSAGMGPNAAVLVDRPGADVTLVLSNYEPVQWTVRATPGTQLERVVLLGYGGSASKVYVDDRPFESVERTERSLYFYSEEGANFRQFVERVPELLGFDRIASFHGSYYACRSALEVRELQYGRLALERDYLARQTSPPDGSSNITFPATLNGVRGIYDLHGNLLQRTSKDFDNREVYVAELEATFVVNENGLIKRYDSGETSQVLLPSDVPRFRGRPLAVTYDPKRKLLIVLASYFSPNGYLHSYDPFNDRWKRLQEVPEFGISEIFYDEVRDQYVRSG
jgi:hypothetical protein